MALRKTDPQKRRVTLFVQSTPGREYNSALTQRATRRPAEGTMPAPRAPALHLRARLRAKRAIDRSGDLLARAGSDRAPQSNAPAFGTPGRALQPQVREYHGLIHVNRDLLGAALGGDMLGACQRRPAAVAGKPEEIC